MPAPGTLPEPQVQAMFDRIAGVYDLMNSVMTAGLHHRWRTRAADMAGLAPGGRALDVATGTDDLAIELSRRVGPQGEVVGSDFSEAMLELARRKAPELRFEHGNALDLPYEDDSFDAATVGFAAADEHERRAKALAARRERRAGVVRQRRSVARRDFAETCLRLLEPPADHSTVPTWIAMIPPAVSSQRTSTMPTAAIAAASPRALGKRRTELGRYE